MECNAVFETHLQGGHAVRRKHASKKPQARRSTAIERAGGGASWETTFLHRVMKQLQMTDLRADFGQLHTKNNLIYMLKTFWNHLILAKVHLWGKILWSCPCEDITDLLKPPAACWSVFVPKAPKTFLELIKKWVFVFCFFFLQVLLRLS